MNRNQLFILIGAMLVLAAIAIAAWVAIVYVRPGAFTPSQPEALPQSDPFGSISVPGSISGAATLTLNATDGQTLTVPDFTKGKEPIEFAGESYYFLYGPEYTTEGFSFSVQYHPGDSSFLIELLSEPIGEARNDAAEYLSELLRIPHASLCAVRAKVVVGGSVNQQFAGYENLGFGGCPESVQLP